MSDRPSCLVKNLTHYVELNESELEQVARFEEDEVSYQKGDEVRSSGSRVNCVHAIKSGWLITSVDLHDGGRQIVRICVPGDIVGLSDLGHHRATQDLTACNDVVLCPFPKFALAPVFAQEPRLAALLTTLTALELATTVDTLRAVGRMSARNRLIYLLLQLLHRLRITVGAGIDGYELPLSQTEIGDAIGLTNVSVSNGLRDLEREGALRRDNKRITLIEPRALARQVDFADRFEQLDTDWFPV